MTNKEALQAAVKYPLEDAEMSLILINRGLAEDGIYTAKTPAFDLAKADAFVLLVTAPNMQEGGFSRSLGNTDNLVKLANGIYAMYGEKSPLVIPAKVTVLKVW